MAIISASKKTGFRGYGNTQFRYAMTYVVVTLVVLFFLNIYCSGVSHKLFYQSKEASMIEKCLLASDEISTLEVLNSSTVTGIVNQLESLKVTRLVVTDHSGAALYDSSGASVGTYVLLPEILQALTVSKQAPEGNNVFTWTYHDGITDSRAATPIVYYGTVVGCVYMTEYDTTQGTLIKSLAADPASHHADAGDYRRSLLRGLFQRLLPASEPDHGLHAHHPGGGLLPQGGHGRQR